MRRLTTLALALGLGAFAAATARGAAPASKSGIAIGDLVWVEGEVTRAEPPEKTTWRKVAAGDHLRTGDTLRTGEDGLVRIEFPWMKLTLAPSSMLTIPASAVLSTVLDQGRAEFWGPGRDIVKIQVGSGEVRGGGRLVVRRSAGRTSVTVLEGAFKVRASGRTTQVEKDEGTLVMDGRAPEPPRGLPRPPKGLTPGTDVGYVRSGQPAELRWQDGGASHVELLALEGEDSVLLARDVAGSPLRLVIPWLGTYRWRVSARDARGVESPHSTAGVVCSVER